jgi:hypothetical protein
VITLDTAEKEQPKACRGVTYYLNKYNKKPMIRIPTRTHGIIDYITAATLLAAPLLTKNGKIEHNDEENPGGSEGKVLAVMGASILTQSLMTDYEMGAIKVIDMPAHLLVDVAGGVLLAASPWLFGMNPRARLPIAAIGLGIAALGLLTNTRPSDEYEESREEE